VLLWACPSSVELLDADWIETEFRALWKDAVPLLEAISAEINRVAHRWEITIMDTYMHERRKARDAFSVKYRGTIDPEAHLWERCAAVLSRREIVTRLTEPW